MENKVGFVERLKRILGDANKETYTIPVVLQEVFDRIIEEELNNRQKKDEYVHDNGMRLIPALSVEDDEYNPEYGLYTNDKTDCLYIFEDGKDYSIYNPSIGSNVIFTDTAKILKKFKEVFEEVKHKRYDEIRAKVIARADELFKSGRIEECSKCLREFADSIDQISNKSAEEYFEMMMAGYEKEMEEFRKKEEEPEEFKTEEETEETKTEEDPEKHFDLSYEMPEEEGINRPRGNEHKPVNRKDKEVKYNERFDAISEMTGCKKYFTNKKRTL